MGIRSAFSVAGFVVWMGFIGALPAASATLWDNGTVTGNTGRCDNAPVGTCLGTGGWTVYDNFLLDVGANVTGFTYSGFGDFSSYTETNWTLWNSDPFAAVAPLASGSATAIVSAGAAGSTRLEISGLDVDLLAGTYWLGIQTVNSTGILTTRASAAGNGLPGFKQSDQLNSGCCEFNFTGDTAFTVQGDTVPEPATVSLFGIGLVSVALLRRRR